jgi:hypothetical protein
MRFQFVAVLAILLTAQGTGQAAWVISSTGYNVGIYDYGELYNQLNNGGVGFQRTSDGYDAIEPGTPRDSWGVSAGTLSGYANHASNGVVNIIPNGVPAFGTSSGFLSTFLNDGGSNFLQIDQSYSFAAANVLKIATTITNVTSVTLPVRFSRNVDFDVAPTQFAEISKVDPLSSPIAAASYGAFESPDPLVPYGFSTPSTGLVSGIGDYGAAYQLDLGTLNAGASSSFNVYYGISTPVETSDDLRNQIYSLGATFVITSESTENYAVVLYGCNSAAVAYGPVPEPGTMVLLFCGPLGLLCYAWRKRR